MLAPALPETSNPASGPDGSTLQRARGVAHVGFAVCDGKTRLADLYQSGSAKVRLPRGSGERQAVLLNTAGGIAGGDELDYSATWGAGAKATVTSQAAERVYRSLGAAGRVMNRLEVDEGAQASWLPQETIVFDGANLQRRLEVDLAGGSRLCAVEAVVLGRAAMGETVRRLHFRDHWRIRRDGRLVYADDVRLVGDPEVILAGPATGDGARTFATILDVAEGIEGDIERARDLLEAARTHPRAEGLSCGVSAWNGVLVVRLLSRDARALRETIMKFLQGWRGEDLPRVWSC
ncbi:urease accessory protein UreD [Breoghania sp.]|uniref:urease accessory protein UreD n=1 Tax=Breoghania sp. TaxID=2065378 RepID=UPI002AA66C60|nr:urease accessory protein UreD [Breoghania sp.]